jgi:hypothetical protein
MFRKPCRRVAHALSPRYAPHEHAQPFCRRVLSMACPGFPTVADIESDVGATRAHDLMPLCRKQCENRLFLPTTRCFIPNYRTICAFSAKKSCCFSGIVSSVPLFSYTSTGRSSFLTSLWASAPFRTLKRTFVSRHNGRRLESSILFWTRDMETSTKKMRSAVGSQPSAFSLLPTAFCLLPTVLWIAPTRCIGRGLASQPAGAGLRN